MKLPSLKMKKVQLSAQQLELILKSSDSHTSYAVIKTILNLPFETSEQFLRQFNIFDSYHFLEHIRILHTQKSVIQVIKNQLLSLAYPFVMLVSSSILLRIFVNQFENILIPMNISIPSHVLIMMTMHYGLLSLLVIVIALYIWIKQSLYRKVLFFSFFKAVKTFKVIYELLLITVILSLSTTQLSLKEIHGLMSKHSEHALMRIMSNDLNQIIEEGKTLMDWLENNSSFPMMRHWVYEQIKEGNTSNLFLWSDQLHIALKQIFIRWKSVLMTGCYGLIIFNIMAMLSIFNLPYEWIHQL
jgi:hypothetical protein